MNYRVLKTFFIIDETMILEYLLCIGEKKKPLLRNNIHIKSRVPHTDKQDNTIISRTNGSALTTMT